MPNDYDASVSSKHHAKKNIHERNFGAKLKQTENGFFYSHKMWNNQPLPSPKIHSKEKMSRTNVEVEHLSILENWAWSENICFKIEHESEKSTWCLVLRLKKGTKKPQKRERKKLGISFKGDTHKCYYLSASVLCAVI